MTLEPPRMSEPGVRSIQFRIVEFVQHLRGLGLPIGVDQAANFAEAFTWIQPLQRSQMYFAARATLVTCQEFLDPFDRAFVAYWEQREAPSSGQKTPQAPRHRPEDFQKPSLVSFMAEKAERYDKEMDLSDRSDTATDVEWIKRKDFSKLSEAELRSLRRAIADLRWDFSRRRSHRLIKSKRGRVIDHRETLRRAAKLAGVVMELPRRVRKEKPRPLVLLADISGSMELYSRIVLQFFHGLSQQLDNTEVFVFGTRLTRITQAFRLKNIDLALDTVSNEVVDFAGGTRIADSLASFRRRWKSKALRRGAVVLLISDGCETRDSDFSGDPSLDTQRVDKLKKEVQALQRSCYRLIWLNPRLGHDHYEPRVQGMAAVLPYIDDFLPIHNFDSLRQLRDHLARLPKRKGGTHEASRRL